MAATPGDRSGARTAAGVETGSLPHVTVSQDLVFDARALRRAEMLPAGSDPTDWTEAEVAVAITDYARYRGHSAPGSGVPDAVVTDLPHSGDRYLGDAVAVEGGLVIRVDEGTRLLGWEQVPLLRTRELTVRADPTGRLQVAHDMAVEGGDLWDLAGLRGAMSGRALALGNVDADSLASLSRIAASAVSEASGFWGRDWDRKLVVVAPQTLEEFADQLGAAPSTARSFGAVTLGHAASSGPDVPGAGQFVGSRVYVNPDGWQELSERGRLFLLSHEATHVAAQGASRPRPPDWLAEGVADDVGFRASRFAAAAFEVPVLDEVRTSGPPAALPGAADFSGDDAAGGARAYAAADVAVQLIERTYGRAALRRLFRDTTALVRGGATQGSALAEAMHDDLRTTPAAFTKAWRAELRRLAAH
jgi:hypothetical protein